MKNFLTLVFSLFLSTLSFSQGPNIGLQLYGYQQPDDLYTKSLEFRFFNALSLQHHFKPISIYARVGMQNTEETRINRYVDENTSISQEYISRTSQSNYFELGAQRYVTITNSDFKGFFRLGGYWASFESESPKAELIGYGRQDYTFTRVGTQVGVSSSLGLEYAVAKKIYVQVESQGTYTARKSVDEIIDTVPSQHPRSSINNYAKRGFSFSPILITVGVNLWNK